MRRFLMLHGGVLTRTRDILVLWGAEFIFCLMWYINYRNRSRFEKNVVARNLLPPFMDHSIKCLCADNRHHETIIGVDEMCVQRVNYASTSCRRHYSIINAVWRTARLATDLSVKSTRSRDSSSPTYNVELCWPSSRKLVGPTRTCRRRSPSSSASKCRPSQTSSWTRVVARSTSISTTPSCPADTARRDRSSRHRRRLSRCRPARSPSPVWTSTTGSNLSSELRRLCELWSADEPHSANRSADGSTMYIADLLPRAGTATATATTLETTASTEKDVKGVCDATSSSWLRCLAPFCKWRAKRYLVARYDFLD